jgi:4-carboxymuconolactone decarboxylase
VGRLARLTRDALTDDQRELFDEIAGSEKPGQRPKFPRVGADNALEGPFNARLLNPAIGMAMQRLSTAIRYSMTLTNRTRELIILVVAATWQSTYEQAAHEDIGRAVGLTDTEISTIASGGIPEIVGDELASVIVARALVDHNDLTDSEYNSAVAELGERKLFEIVCLVGSYAQTALQLRVFRVEPPTC